MQVKVELSIGELIDKITILEIKLANISDPEKRANVRLEHETLSVAAPDDVVRDERIAVLRAELKAVNSELWRIEDDIRAKERARMFDEQFIDLARSVYRTNDRRAALKREINLLTKSRLIEEKSYAKY